MSESTDKKLKRIADLKSTVKLFDYILNMQDPRPNNPGPMRQHRNELLRTIAEMEHADYIEPESTHYSVNGREYERQRAMDICRMVKGHDQDWHEFLNHGELYD